MGTNFPSRVVEPVEFVCDHSSTARGGSLSRPCTLGYDDLAYLRLRDGLFAVGLAQV